MLCGETGCSRRGRGIARSYFSENAAAALEEGEEEAEPHSNVKKFKHYPMRKKSSRKRGNRERN
jgi:hypothetical protein